MFLLAAISSGCSSSDLTSNVNVKGSLAYSLSNLEESNPDVDSDGILNEQDNCLYTANENQIDSDVDGYGNACDGDFNNDGIVGGPDYTAFALSFGKQPTDPEFNPATDANNDSIIGGPDYTAFAIQFSQRVPGPSGLSCVGTVPCGNAGATSAAVACDLAVFTSYDENLFSGTSYDEESNRCSYNLSSPQDFIELANSSSLWSKNFIMHNQVDLSPTNMAGANLDPIGNIGTPFSGRFDGNEFPVQKFANSYIGTTGGFFGVIAATGVVTDFHILDSNITFTSTGTTYSTGTIAGTNNGLISKSSVSGTITGSQSGTVDFGGLVGSNNSTGTIEQSRFFGTLNSVCTGTGGLVGQNQGLVKNSYAHITINTHAASGGCSNIGGLIGDSYFGTLQNSFAAAIITGNNSAVGGATGSGLFAFGSGNFYDSDVLGMNVEGSTAEGLSTQEMQSMPKFAAYNDLFWDFSDVADDELSWLYHVNDYPKQVWEVSVAVNNGGSINPQPNFAPIAVDKTYNVDQDSVDNPASMGATDADGHSLTYRVDSAPIHGSYNAVTHRYTPNAGFVGADTFTFIANDGFDDSNIGTITINVNAVISNTAPVAELIALSMDENTAPNFNVPLTVTLGGMDNESDPLTFEVLTQPTNGTLSGTAPHLTYIPTYYFNGSDSFTYRVNDGELNSATSNVSITVSATRKQHPSLAALLKVRLKTSLFQASSI